MDIFKDPYIPAKDAYGHESSINVAELHERIKQAFLSSMSLETKEKVSENLSSHCIQKYFNVDEPVSNAFLSDFIDCFNKNELPFILIEKSEKESFVNSLADSLFYLSRYYLEVMGFDNTYDTHLVFLWRFLGTVKTAALMTEILDRYIPMIDDVASTPSGILLSMTKRILSDEASATDLLRMNAEFIVDVFTPKLSTLD